MNLALYFSLLGASLFIAPMIFAAYKRDWLVLGATPFLIGAIIARILQDPQPEFDLFLTVTSTLFFVMTAFIFIDHTNDRGKIIILPAHLSSTGKFKTLVTGIAFLAITILLMLILAQVVENGRITRETKSQANPTTEPPSLGQPGQPGTNGGGQGGTGGTGGTGQRGQQGPQGIPGPPGPAATVQQVPTPVPQGLLPNSNPLLGGL